MLILSNVVLCYVYYYYYYLRGAAHSIGFSRVLRHNPLLPSEPEFNVCLGSKNKPNEPEFYDFCMTKNKH